MVTAFSLRNKCVKFFSMTDSAVLVSYTHSNILYLLVILLYYYRFVVR